MLIHKVTMGVLDRIWTGQHTTGPDGRKIPLDRPAVLSDVENPEEWWEIPGTGPLARTVRMYYPWIIPQSGPDGVLAGVQVQRDAPNREPDRTTLLEEARKRGYKQAGRMRPKGLFSFLGVSANAPERDIPDMLRADHAISAPEGRIK